MRLPIRFPFSYRCLDFETTSKYPTSARVVEVAIVTVDGGAVVHSWSTLVNPGVPIDPEAIGVHGIADADVADAPTFADVCPDLFALLCEGLPILAHNGARFDVPVLRAELARMGLELPDGIEFVDTLPICRQALPGKPSHTLGAVAAALDCIPADGQWHRALADVQTLARIVECLRDMPDLPAPELPPRPALPGYSASVPAVIPGGAVVTVATTIVGEAVLALAAKVNPLQADLAFARSLACASDDEERILLELCDKFRKEIKALDKLRTDYTGKFKPQILEIEREFRDKGVKPLQAAIDALEAARKPFAIERARAVAEAADRARREAEQIAMAARAAELAKLAPVEDDALARAMAGDLVGAAASLANIPAALDAANDTAQVVYEDAMVAAAAIVPVPVRLPGAVVRDKLTWAIRVDAPDMVPRNLCSPDLEKIRRYVEMTDGEKVIPGVFFELDVATSSRSRRA